MAPMRYLASTMPRSTLVRTEDCESQSLAEWCCSPSCMAGTSHASLARASHIPTIGGSACSSSIFYRRWNAEIHVCWTSDLLLATLRAVVECRDPRRLDVRLTACYIESCAHSQESRCGYDSCRHRGSSGCQPTRPQVFLRQGSTACSHLSRSSIIVNQNNKSDLCL